LLSLSGGAGSQYPLQEVKTAVEAEKVQERAFAKAVLRMMGHDLGLMLVIPNEAAAEVSSLSMAYDGEEAIILAQRWRE
jgi:hypothetical protein